MKHEKFNGETEINTDHDKNELETTTDILKSEQAQNILPYLTLNELNNDEKRGLLDLSNHCLSLMEHDELPVNKMYRINTIEDIIASISGNEESWTKDRIITPKLAEARKLFCASLFNATNNINKPNIKYEIYDSFFGISPGLDSYCGGLGGSLELLTIAERTPSNLCARELYGEIIYNYSFAKQNGFESVLNQSSPIQQLRLLPIYNNIALQCDPDDYSNGALNQVLDALNTLEQDKTTKPLVKLTAENINNNISDWFNTEWVDIDENIPEHREILKRDAEKRKVMQQEQEKLHSQFTALPNNQNLTVITPDTAAIFTSSGVLDIISNKEGQTASLLNYSKENPFGLDQDAAFLIGAAHNPDIKNLINEKTGLKLEQVPLEAQAHLLKYMTEANSERFDKLCGTLHGIDKNLRLKLAENFLAADFGEDFGDSLLTIAESKHLNGNEKAKIFDTITSCRESINKITSLYGEFDDGKFTKEYARASNERLTDAVTVFSQIAKKGSASADLDWAGKPNLDFKAAIEALGYEAKSLEIISGTLDDITTGKEGSFAEMVLQPEGSSGRLGRTLYNLYSPDHGYVLLYTRPEGSESFDSSYEYGKFSSKYGDRSNAGVEASVSLITNPKDPFSLPNPFRPDRHKIKNPTYYDHSTMDKVSAIRLDREGRTPDMAADDASRSPINPTGMVSVDLAAIGDRADTPSGKIARLLSLGNKLRADKSHTESSLNHNTNWFDQDKYGSTEGFRQLVEYIDAMATKLCSEHEPGKNDESFTKIMREASQKIGKKALAA